jgi:hypothetical protein
MATRCPAAMPLHAGDAFFQKVNRPAIFSHPSYPYFGGSDDVQGHSD